MTSLLFIMAPYYKVLPKFPLIVPHKWIKINYLYIYNLFVSMYVLCVV